MGLFGSSSKSTSVATHGDTGAADSGLAVGGIETAAIIDPHSAAVAAGKQSDVFSTMAEPGSYSFVIGEGATVEGLTLSTPPRQLGEDILKEIRQKTAPVTGNTTAGMIAGAIPALLIAGAAWLLFSKGGKGIF